jgi:endonuclease/exonuclease/phosphatase family metal-dependent hydrolase
VSRGIAEYIDGEHYEAGLKIVAYNVHKCRGMDGRTRVGRIAEVLAGIDADVVALQEVFASEPGRHSQVEILAAELGLNSVFGRTQHKYGRPYGNAILSRWPILSSRKFDLPWTRREQRGCIRADIESPFGVVQALNIHMGASYFERRHQIRAFVNEDDVHRELNGSCLLMGDSNEW